MSQTQLQWMEEQKAKAEMDLANEQLATFVCGQSRKPTPTLQSLILSGFRGCSEADKHGAANAMAWEMMLASILAQTVTPAMPSDVVMGLVPEAKKIIANMCEGKA